MRHYLIAVFITFLMTAICLRAQILRLKVYLANTTAAPVRGDDVDARSRPRALGEGAFLKNGLDLLDFFAVNGGLSGPYLEPVVFRRVVAGGDHDAALPVEVLDRKIERGGG